MNIIPRHSIFDLDHFLDHQWSPFQVSTQRAENFTPRVDIEETEAAYGISAELPGVNKDDINVTLSEGVLTLEAESKSESKEEKDGRVIRQERRYGKYVRSFQLGKEVHDADVSASFKDGVLKLSIPKVPPKAPEAKRIEIQSH